MREIKFRGKRVDNGEWINGYLLKDDITGQVFILPFGNSVNESDKVGEEGCLRFFAFEVEENTICQYTGLKDKNGMGLTEVFEGDIISEDGILKGNIYENDKRETDIVVPQLGTKDWETTYKEIVVRGYDYSE